MSRPDQQRPVVFDLVGGDGSRDADGPVDGTEATAVPGGGSAGEDGADAGSGGAPPAGRRRPRLSRRAWLLTAAAVVVVAVALTAVDLVRDHRRAELMRTSPVGVASLADPPEESWAVPFDASFGGDAFVDQPVVVMDGALVLLPATVQDVQVLDPSTGAMEPASAGFADVTAVDPATGDVLWRVPVDENPACGPVSYDASARTDLLTCLQGPDDAREVLTITPDGGTRVRPAEQADGERLFVGPEGMVVRVRPADEQAGHHEVRVVAEDAVTGTERWTEDVDLTPIEGYVCTDQGEPGQEAAPYLNVLAGTETIVVQGCGRSVTLSVDGLRLDQPGDDAPGEQTWVTELGAGRFAVQVSAGESVVVDETGAVLGALDGFAQRADTSPDAPADLWFVGRPSGTGFDAVREDGSVAWTEQNGTRVLLAARDVVVMERGSRLIGLDRGTGAQLWEWTDDDPRGLSRFRTVTDGETVATLNLPHEGGGKGALVAIDLGTGEERWSVPVTGTVVAVGGHLVEVTADGLRGLG